MQLQCPRTIPPIGWRAASERIRHIGQCKGEQLVRGMKCEFMLLSGSLHAQVRANSRRPFPSIDCQDSHPSLVPGCQDSLPCTASCRGRFGRVGRSKQEDQARARREDPDMGGRPPGECRIPNGRPATCFVSFEGRASDAFGCLRMPPVSSDASRVFGASGAFGGCGRDCRAAQSGHSTALPAQGVDVRTPWGAHTLGAHTPSTGGTLSAHPLPCAHPKRCAPPGCANGQSVCTP